MLPSVTAANKSSKEALSAIDPISQAWNALSAGGRL